MGRTVRRDGFLRSPLVDRQQDGGRMLAEGRTAAWTILLAAVFFAFNVVGTGKRRAD